MTFAELLIRELDQEAVTTQRVLERVPEDRFAWKPHAKSMSLGQLAFHVAALTRGIADLLTPLVAEPPTVPLAEPASSKQLLATLAESVAIARRKLADWGDEGLHAEWQLLIDGKPAMAMPRIDMVRSLMLNHWYHHRGQLLVYLRLLDISVPPVYGPTADENPFG